MEGYNMAIRFAEREDLNQVNILRKEVNDIHVVGKPTIFKKGFSKELQDYVYEVFEDPLKKIIVYEIDNSICSFAILNDITKQENPYMYERDYLDIDELCVDEEFRRKGIATEIMYFTKEYAKKEVIKRIVLNMWEFNESALDFY